MELPCIHIAKDSQKLICTETLIFGYYYSKSGKYQAIICGGDLTNELWKQAKTSFAKHGGTRKNDLEPKQRTKPVQKATSLQPEKVKFVREEHFIKNGVPTTYQIYKGLNTESAKAFLQKNLVTKNFYYIIVETPEGNYGRDIQGIYKEQT